MTQEVLDLRILNAQIKTAYQFSDQILKPACYGTFNESLANKAKIQNQLLKALWRFKIDENESCSCLTEDQVCDILNFLDNQIKTPYLPPNDPTTTTINDETITFIFNLVSLGCDKACVSDYRDIRISIYTGQGIVGAFSLSQGTLNVVDQDTVSVSITTTLTGSLFMNFIVEEVEGVFETIVQGHLLTILKQE